MNRSTAPDELWHELRKAACAHLQAAIDYERAIQAGREDHKDYIWLALKTELRSKAITAIVAAEIAAEQAKENS